MNKKCIVAGLAVLMGLSVISGCSSDNDTKDPVNIEEQEITNTDEPDKITIAEDTQTENDVPASEAADKEEQDADDGLRSVTVYYVDDLSGVVVGKTAEIRDEFGIWDVLKDRGILTDDCELLSIKLNSDETMDLDFNHATAERINSMGTTGETEIIGCIVNTYLEAYDCTGIRLLEEGKEFISSHGAEFGGYTGRIEFK